MNSSRGVPDPLPAPAASSGVRSPGIEDYYRGASVLLTGGTGLLGKVLLESILRKLPSVERVYVLIRPRMEGGRPPRSPAHRLRTEILDSSAFGPLRARHGERFDAFVAERVEAVSGDLARDRLGMAEETYRRLQREVDVVIHSGASAVFDAPLDVALETNALGPLRILEFARGAPRPPFVAHISTCYVNRLAGPVFESPLDPRETPAGDGEGESYDVDEEVVAIRQRLARPGGTARPADRERLAEEGMAWARRRGWNDTYTFSKAMGEQLFVRHQGTVPGLILRPSIIESALRTPVSGWMDGFRMLDPLIIGFARGQIFEFPGNPESVVDVVPVDVVANALLAAIPWTHARGGLRVYQVASGMENPLVLKRFVEYLVEYYERFPLPGGVASGRDLPRLSFPETRRFLRRLELRYVRPLRLLERAASLLRFTRPGERVHARLRARRAGVERLRHYAYIYGPYAESQARFLAFNVRQLWSALAPADRAMFPFDIRSLRWRRYLQEIHLPGIESHLLGLRRRGGAPGGVPETESAREPETDGASEPERSSRPAALAGVGGAVDAAGPDAPGPAESPDAGQPRWSRTERLFAVMDSLDPAEVKRWITPAYKKAIRRVSFGIIRTICRYHLRLECAGREHVPERGPFIVVCNHTSHVDTGVLLAAFGPMAEKVHPAAATDYWFRNSFLGWVLHSTLGAIPFDRHAENVLRALSLPAEVLRTGHSLIFYPEGGRSPTGELRPFKTALGLLALASAVPVLPVYIRGAYEALPKGEAIIKHHPVRLRFGPTIAIEPYLARLDRESVGDLARNLTEAVQGAVESLRGGPGSPSVSTS